MRNIVFNEISNSGICSWASILLFISSNSSVVFRFIYFSDPSVIVLTEHDVDDPHVHIDIENIRAYSMGHLQNWLLYRGDTLKGIANLRDAPVKVLSTLNKGQNRNYMTQPQTKNACQKKREWWKWPWKKHFKGYVKYTGFDNLRTWRTYVRLSYRYVHVIGSLRMWSRTHFSFSSRP